MTDREDTEFDKKIDTVVQSGANFLKDLAKCINHFTDDIARKIASGEPAKPNPDTDITTKVGK